MREKNMEPPKLEFGLWSKWEDRTSIEGARYPGVYALAMADEDLAGKPVQYTEIQYIGMSNSLGGLKGRWSQFNKAIHGDSGRHSGGDSAFRDLGPYPNWQKKLFVAAFPVQCEPKEVNPENLRKMGLVTYLEYEAFAQFCERHPDRAKPKYNKR